MGRRRSPSKQHALFLGRGLHYPIALEGALKLKEISYIHAEAYPAGELKHGPLALVDRAMPVVAIAPNDALLEKLKSNLQEVRARGGELYVVADLDSHLTAGEGIHLIRVPEHAGPAVARRARRFRCSCWRITTAVLRGTDVDKPRNLAKSRDGGVGRRAISPAAAGGLSEPSRERAGRTVTNDPRTETTKL